MTKRRAIDFSGFVMDIIQDRKEEWDDQAYPFNLAAVRSWETLELNENVTIFVGENGAGKSTLIEAIAVAAGFNAEGGNRNFRFTTRKSHSDLNEHIRLIRAPIREKEGFFLRAESFYNVATQVDNLGYLDSYGGQSLHEQSHGESFMALIENRFSGKGLYILDEPEAALSPRRQLALLARIQELVDKNSQFIIATHSPILMAYPGAWIYELDDFGPQRIEWEQAEHVKLTKQFLDRPDIFLKTFLNED